MYAIRSYYGIGAVALDPGTEEVIVAGETSDRGSFPVTMGAFDNAASPARIHMRRLGISDHHGAGRVSKIAFSSSYNFV